jgi:hypothetical protein
MSINEAQEKLNKLMAQQENDFTVTVENYKWMAQAGKTRLLASSAEEIEQVRKQDLETYFKFILNFCEIVAEVHTHGAYAYSDQDPSGWNGVNNFSKRTAAMPVNGDIDKYDNYKIYGYVATPNGSLLWYDWFSKKVTLLNQDQASDPNDPTSKNYRPPRGLIPREKIDNTRQKQSVDTSRTRRRN